MKINKASKIYGVLGFPVSHSLSPLMHNAAFRRLKISAKYLLFEKNPRVLKSFLRCLPLENIHGLNVTVPYKEKVIPLLNYVSAEARLIGAVNTIVAKNNKLYGYNTDGAGFIRHLTTELKFNPKGKTASIIGAGGASKAIAIYLARSGIKQLGIFDVDKGKLAALVRHLKENFPHIKFIAAPSIESLKDADILINATPVGMKPKQPCLVDEIMIRPDMLVYDLIYNPKETKLLKVAKRRGAKVSNGLGMLLHQGALSFKYFTGKKAPIGIMRKALNRGVKNL